MAKESFNVEETLIAAQEAGIDFDSVDFTVEQLNEGMNIELEHGLVDPETNVSNDDATATAKIAWAHLKESKDYYTFLDKMESEMEI